MKLREKQAAWPTSLWVLTAEYAKREEHALIPPSIANHSKDSLVLFHRNEIKLGKQLGKGAFSEVSEVKAFLSTEHQSVLRSFFREHATHESTGQSRFVIKHLKSSLMSNPEDFQMAARDLAIEAHLLSAFRHANILKLRGLAADGVDAYRSGRHDGYFLIFDRLEETLDQRINVWRNESCDEPLKRTRGYRRDFSEPLKYASQVASAISYLHERDIIYRDLKPKNIGINASGNVKLFDFGFARLLPHKRNVDDTFKMTGRIGTLRYMAPEVALKEPYNLKADVYSWSIILWEMLSLENPYQTIPREQFLTLVCQREERHKLDHGWPEPVRDLIGRSWANLVSTRPTMQEVYALFTCVQDEMTRKECAEDAETINPTPSNGLGFPPALVSENLEQLAGTIRTTSSTRESIARDRGTVSQHARGDGVYRLMNERGEDGYRNRAQHSPAPTIFLGGRPTGASIPNASARPPCATSSTATSNRESTTGVSCSVAQLALRDHTYRSMEERGEGVYRNPAHHAPALNAMGGRPADASSSNASAWPSRATPRTVASTRESTARDSGTETQQARGDHAYRTTDERGKDGYRNAAHHTPAPHAMGGRPADASSPNASAWPSRGTLHLGQSRVGNFFRGMRRNPMKDGTR